MSNVFIPRERGALERRVAATPETVRKLVRRGFAVRVERGAGEGAYFPDDAYAEAGATLVDGGAQDWGGASVVLKVGPPTHNDTLGADEADALAEGATLIGFLDPFADAEHLEVYKAKKISTLSMELVPRTSRAQSMDALSSQASAAGYLAVVYAAARLPKYFPLMMTAAGTIKPARVVVLGAGVAGLQAIATAKRLGAIVEVSDIRPDVAEQVESLGARFIPLPDTGESGAGEGGYARQVTEAFLTEQRKIVREHLIKADVVIATAQVPGKKAPLLVPQSVVDDMKPGAVLVDLAASSGGNCEATVPGEEVRAGGVQVLGRTDMLSVIANDASAMYARNVEKLVELIAPEGEVQWDMEDDIVHQTLWTHGGELVSPRAQAIWGTRGSHNPAEDSEEHNDDAHVA
ncbi:MAG: Re/Si-specific NAD(P)(+) transhydrogenase subunit alpha [Myxococcota bacterium]